MVQEQSTYAFKTDRDPRFTIVEEARGISSSVNESNVEVQSEESSKLLDQSDDLSLLSWERDSGSVASCGGSTSRLYDPNPSSASLMLCPFLLSFFVICSSIRSLSPPRAMNKPAIHAAIIIATAAATPIIAVGEREFDLSSNWIEFPVGFAYCSFHFAITDGTNVSNDTEGLVGDTNDTLGLAVGITDGAFEVESSLLDTNETVGMMIAAVGS
jgi:hypothetical protein